ncbi:MAG: hypothetical protein NWE95_05440 [Candidatus Bathyarchaeota archaeon]|nr:hypothetical protein [Candidatus Bathyarchaeota archaeon]
MKSNCQVCGATFKGIPLITVKDGKQVEACPVCFKKLDEEYKKNSCIACVFFNMGSCELFGTDLEEPYVQNKNCDYFSTDPDPTSMAKARIKKFELTGRFDKAAEEYEKLGMKEKAEEARKKVRDKPVRQSSVDEAISQLAERGQSLTYFCCHCGAALKVGANHPIQKTCPNCKYDLTVIDMARLISQHM